MHRTNEERPTEGVGLALSGGGFRATLFHLGSLWRLNEIGWLPKLSRVCSVSGGSIVSGLLGLRWGELDFDENGVARAFDSKLVRPIQAFCKRWVDGWSILSSLALCSRARTVSRLYNKHLFHDATLQDLPHGGQGPRFVIYATNLQTSSSVRFSQPYLADYRLGLYRLPTISLAEAVAASSAFPPLLSPMKLKLNEEQWDNEEGASLAEERGLRNKLVLTDGGVYDNLGLENVWKRYTTVLVSDAGAPLETKHWVFLQTLRSLFIMSAQTRALRLRRLMDDYKKSVRAGTFWGINTEIDGYELSNALVKDNATTARQASVRTRLNRFSDQEQGQLINWGYALTDAAMRRYVLKQQVPTPAWPIPEFKLA